MQRILSYLRAWWRRDDAAGATPAADPPPSPSFLVSLPLPPAFNKLFCSGTAADATFWQLRESFNQRRQRSDSFTVFSYRDFSCWTSPQTGKERDS